MKTDRLIDDTSLPVVQTAFARIFLPPQPPEKPEGVDVLVTARDRLHEREVIRVAAFCAIWSLIAALCFLPWGGQGWWVVPRTIFCLLLWLPAWAFAMQLIGVGPAAICAVLADRNVLTAREAHILSQALAALAFSVAAFMLVASSCVVCQIVGNIWLFALLFEGMLRLVLLASKLLK